MTKKWTNQNLPGALHYVTGNVINRIPVFKSEKCCKGFLDVCAKLLRKWPAKLVVYVVMPDHFHLLAGVRDAEKNLSELIGFLKSYTTQQYWKRSREIVNSGQVILPSTSVTKASIKESGPLISALMDWRATLRPEVVELKNWPNVKPEHFLKKRLWQKRLWDHVIRNDVDLQENLDYIAMNPVREGYVTQPQFYPYTGFLL